MFRKVKIANGLGYLHRLTILEIKWLFSIYFHIFNTVEQDRFHTHAFNGVACVLRGGYEEEWIDSRGVIHRKYIRPGIRYIPRNYNHRILKSIPNTISFVFCGPWSSTWTEENDQYIRTLTWGRKEVDRVSKQIIVDV